MFLIKKSVYVNSNIFIGGSKLFHHMSLYAEKTHFLHSISFCSDERFWKKKELDNFHSMLSRKQSKNLVLFDLIWLFLCEFCSRYTYNNKTIWEQPISNVTAKVSDNSLSLSYARARGALLPTKLDSCPQMPPPNQEPNMLWIFS